MSSRRIDARDEEGDVVIGLRACSPGQLPGFVSIEIGGFKMAVSGATAKEIGDCFHHAARIAREQAPEGVA